MIPRSGVAGPCRSSVSFLRVFQVDFTLLAGLLSVLTSTRLRFCLHCSQRLLLIFFRTPALTRARWDPSIVSIFTFFF